MASNIIEFFGRDPRDNSAVAVQGRRQTRCPFLGATCVKTLNDGEISGTCTLKPATSGPVICCPIRLYANNYQILTDVAKVAFGANMPPLAPGNNVPKNQDCIAVFGKRWGKELRLPSRATGVRPGAYFVDWVLAHINAAGDLISFVAVEVQSIDTTGNYRAERSAYLKGGSFTGSSTAGLNWENVNKRILPQLIYKGHVLQREPLCQKGLFFVCPKPVYTKIDERLGSSLSAYPIQPGALTIMWYDIGPPVAPGNVRALNAIGRFTTTVNQVALAFTAPSNLPPAQVYEKAIRNELGK